MTGTALSVVKQGAPLAPIDMTNINYDIAERWLQSQGGSRAFAGEQLAFNGQDGVYKIGFGNKALELDDLELVVNIPYLANVWQRWDGKAPEYPYIALPFVGQALPNRDTLGLTDQSLWQENKFKKGEKIDPWKEVLVLVCRTEKGRLFHMMGNNITSRNSILALVRDAVVDGKRNHGKLPVVKFTAEKIKGDDGNFYVMKTEILRWVKMEAIDNPGAEMVVSTDATPPADEPEARTVAKPRTQKAKVEAAPVEEAEVEEAPKTVAKPRTRMAAPLDEEDDGEGGEVEEVKPAPKRRTLQ